MRIDFVLLVFFTAMKPVYFICNFPPFFFQPSDSSHFGGRGKPPSLCVNGNDCVCLLLVDIDNDPHHSFALKYESLSID